MADTTFKLQPNRDLACYYQLPSAIAALSATSLTGFNVSGSWRQQFDWAVVEWNRDNVFDHPAFRNLPDGDLSGITLSYLETRTNCIALDSNLYPTVDWPYLRFWLDTPGGEVFHRVRLSDFATAAVGSYSPASATFTITGSVTAGDVIELAWDPFATEHYNYTLGAQDTLTSALAQLALAINAFSTSVVATTSGSSITLTRTSTTAGANDNTVGVYATVSGAQTEIWQPVSQTFTGGTSPTQWQVTIPFGSLIDADSGNPFVPNTVRKMRWTYAAALQPSSFQRGEFEVRVSSWSVTGSNLVYNVAGPGSRRIEDDSAVLTYSGAWSPSSANRGNYSGGSIAYTASPNSSVQIPYSEQGTHQLYLGTRRTPAGGVIQCSVDGAVQTFNLDCSDDVLVRIGLGTFAPGDHNVTVTFTGPQSTYFYFDFLEIAYPTQALPVFAPNNLLTLATDWDTYHSLALPPEHTAWMMSSLGFTGRANHYQGALWFFEMTRLGQIYASGTITFGGTSSFSAQTSITVDTTTWTHVHLGGDTPATVAAALALQINNGSTGIWAAAAGPVLTVSARAMGAAGNLLALAVTVVQAPGAVNLFTAAPSGSFLQGGIDGTASGVGYMDTPANIGWRTDLAALPRMNRAARDWCSSYFTALTGYGIAAAASFSTELQFADPSTSVGVAQRYFNGNAVEVNTPAIQTNFSPASLAFWQEVYLEMAMSMQLVGQTPYLQFGEVQWWYFPDAEPSMPFYDAYTQQQFQATYARPISLIPGNTTQPSLFPQEAAFLPSLIGQFTAAIMSYVLASVPQCKFEVLYPPDVNNYAFTSVINYPASAWTPSTLNCLKTENFTYTGNRNLDLVAQSVNLPGTLGFPPSQRSHLVGISDYTSPWGKEVGLALGQNDESVVLFALDQFCLIGYPLDFYKNIQRGLFMP